MSGEWPLVLWERSWSPNLITFRAWRLSGRPFHCSEAFHGRESIPPEESEFLLIKGLIGG